MIMPFVSSCTCAANQRQVNVNGCAPPSLYDYAERVPIKVTIIHALYLLLSSRPVLIELLNMPCVIVPFLLAGPLHH